MDMTGAQDLIVDDRARGIFRVNRRVFTDPEILEEERRHRLANGGGAPHGTGGAIKGRHEPIA